MRIGIDAVAIIPGKTGGIETYAVELIRELSAQVGHDVVVFSQPGLREIVNAHDVRFVEVPEPSANLTEAFLMQLSWLPHMARKERVDVLHHTKNYVCGKLGIRQILTLCDVFPEYFLRTEPLRSGVRNYARTIFMSASARLADHVITISESSAADITRVCGVPASRISVTPLAPKRLQSDGVHPAPELAPGYFLAIGKAAPYKNLLRLVRAFRMISTSRHLVIAGVPYAARDAETREICSLVEQTHGRIKMLGYVPDENLSALYRSARTFVCPSLIEGFGLPALEAATRGVPVAVSDIRVHREVMGDAACRFDPLDEGSIASALKQLDVDDAYCAKLSIAGTLRAAQFSWKRTAVQTLAVYGA